MDNEKPQAEHSHYSEMGEQLWESTPMIDGLSEKENLAIYKGNFDMALDRLRSMPDDKKRDMIIQNIIAAIGSRIKELVDVQQIAETEWKNEKMAKEYQTGLDYLNRFYDSLLELHKGEQN